MKYILVIEQCLGRKLNTERGGKKGEMVHHIDGDKLNNNIDNLELCEDAKDHRLLHHSLQECAFELVRQGFIVFNKDKREYECRID